MTATLNVDIEPAFAKRTGKLHAAVAPKTWPEDKFSVRDCSLSFSARPCK